MKYRVYLAKSAEIYVPIEAESLEDAEEAALRKARTMPKNLIDIVGEWEIIDVDEIDE